MSNQEYPKNSKETMSIKDKKNRTPKKESVEMVEKKETEIISVEDYVQIIDKIIDEAENKFYSQYNRYPSWIVEQDYVLFSDFLNFKYGANTDNPSDMYKQLKNKVLNNGEKKSEWMLSAVQGSYHEIPHRLIIRYLKREGVFNGENQNKMFDAMVGRINYNVPKEEFGYRLKLIEDLQKNGVDIPSDDWKKMRDLTEKISKICFLHETYKNDKKAYERGYTLLGTNFVNPSAQDFGIHDFLYATDRGSLKSGETSYEAVVNKLKRWGHYS